MVAYHFPPLAGSSGIQRTLRFVQHLPAFGWFPLVLTAHPRAYEKTSDDLICEIPQGTVVERAFALDTRRHLSLFKRYPAFLARPDRWLSWKFSGIATGLRMIREHSPDVIWSTYPIATAHLIGAELHKKTGIPWIADFRDPMAQQDYPPDTETRKSFLAIERTVFQHSSACVFTTPGCASMYRERYPESPEDRFRIIENGYDEDSFSGIDAVTDLIPDKITLLHSGIVYPSERDPSHFFQALSELKRRHILTSENFCIRFRAPAHDAHLRRLAAENAITDLIDIAPNIPYRDALVEMTRANGLVIMQASNCNDQIPAKAYEYLRAGRPILGLTDPLGDTANLLRRAGGSTIAPLDSAKTIQSVLLTFLEEIRQNTGSRPDPKFVVACSRKARAAELAELLGQIANRPTLTSNKSAIA